MQEEGTASGDLSWTPSRVTAPSRRTQPCSRRCFHQKRAGAMAEYDCTPEAAGQSPTRTAGRTDDRHGISSLVPAELMDLSTAIIARHAPLERTNTQQSQSQSSRAYPSVSYSTTRTVDTRAPPHFFHDKPYPSPGPVQLCHHHRQSIAMAGPPVAIRNHGVAALAEFVGTFMFLLISFAGTQIANASPVRADDTTAPNVAVLIYISFIILCHGDRTWHAPRSAGSQMTD